MLALLLSLCTIMPCVTVAGDSVVIQVALADNASPVVADSVEFYIDMASQASIKKAVVAKVPGTTTARFAYALTAWSVGQTKGGQIGARYKAAAGASDWTFSPTNAWTYTRQALPAAPEADKLTVQSVGLN